MYPKFKYNHTHNDFDKVCWDVGISMNGAMKAFALAHARPTRLNFFFDFRRKRMKESRPLSVLFFLFIYFSFSFTVIFSFSVFSFSFCFFLYPARQKENRAELLSPARSNQIHNSLFKISLC